MTASGQFDQVRKNTHSLSQSSITGANKMKTFLMIFIPALIILLIFILVPGYFGLFYRINIVEKTVGPFTILYEKHVGDYRGAGAVSDRLYYELLDEHHIECKKGFGIYYDKPGETETEKLRCITGNILEDVDAGKLAELEKKYTIKVFPETKAVYSEFPFKSTGEKGSGKMFIVMSLMRTYPALEKYLQEKNYPRTPIMEIYDVPGQKISYITAVNLDPAVLDGFLD